MADRQSRFFFVSVFYGRFGNFFRMDWQTGGQPTLKSKTNHKFSKPQSLNIVYEIKCFIQNLVKPGFHSTGFFL
jgi:hypothetical protein